MRLGSGLWWPDCWWVVHPLGGWPGTLVGWSKCWDLTAMYRNVRWYWVLEAPVNAAG